MERPRSGRSPGEPRSAFPLVSPDGRTRSPTSAPSSRSAERERLVLSPEDRLILLLARGRLPPPLVEEARSLLAMPLGWNRVLERATVHEVYPLVHHHLRALDPPCIPGDFRGALDGLARINALRNTLLAEELARVLDLLAGAGIPAAP